uniref:Uncharacterized protein n=1 Tax=Timema cristinae TaxID=61476 RepID=A0A7R9DJP9_TIMCR|nr:unnamed protein product [Timema cristinae]
MRHSGSSFPQRPSCQHKAVKAFHCSDVTMQDVRRIHQKFYADTNRQAHNNFILRHVTVETPNRQRSRIGNMEYRKKIDFHRSFKLSYCEIGSRRLWRPKQEQDSDRYVGKVFITRCSILGERNKGEVNYNLDMGEGKSKLKWGKPLHSIAPTVTEEGTTLKKEKLQDLNILMTKHFQANWREKEQLTFFKDIFEKQEAMNEPNEYNSDIGEILEEEEGLVV